MTGYGSLGINLVSDSQLETRKISTTPEVFTTESKLLEVVQFVHDENGFKTLESIIDLEVPCTLTGIGKNLFQCQGPSTGMQEDSICH